MSTVVDIGCASWGPLGSVERLVERFRPDMLLGLDPASEDHDCVIGETRVLIRKRAGWIEDGTVGFHVDGPDGGITDSGDRVACVDVAGVIKALEPPVILKLDCEGSEYTILERLVATGYEPAMLLVEWHRYEDGSHTERRQKIEAELTCEVEEWMF